MSKRILDLILKYGAAKYRAGEIRADNANQWPRELDRADQLLAAIERAVKEEVNYGNCRDGKATIIK